MGRKPEIKRLKTIDDLDSLQSGESINLKNRQFPERIRFVTKHVGNSYEFARQICNGLKFYLIKKEKVYVEEGCLNQRPLSKIPQFIMELNNPANMASYEDLKMKFGLRIGEMI